MTAPLVRPALAWDQRANLPMTACADEMPWGAPTSTKTNVVDRCLEGFALQHDNDARIATWVAYTVTPEEALGCFPRTNAFVAHAAVPKGQRAETSDYAKSGYDQGHLAPDGDMSWNQQVEYESFLLSNMSPQVPNVNRGVWKYIETTVRAWTWERGHTFAVYAGNIYAVGTSKTIGANKVIVPDSLFKVAVDTVTGEVFAFILPNVGKLETTDPKRYAVSVADIEAQAGITLPLPAGADKKAVRADLPPVNMGGLTDAKRAACKTR
ncbi:MAG: DNA/RNA non-specific endonuclease [Actinobacteria bacterium]|nr:DNA/RNA non-specific endonuclease [Actinomycetota bacterium]NBR67092.1 DNA/RNA non-specific endonuclease [Actinomycetota bacterium]